MSMFRILTSRSLSRGEQLLFPRSRTVRNKLCSSSGRLCHAQAKARARSSLEPIVDLHIKDSIERVPQNGSVVANMFLGRLDTEILSFPQVIATESHYNVIAKRSKNITENFASCMHRTDVLNNFGFNDLWKLSVTETMNIFESIGSSCSLKHSDIVDHLESMKSGLPVSTSSVNPIFTNDSVKTITQLIIQNCIIRKLMGCADNRNLADKVSSMLDSKPDMKIGYAFSERNANLGVSHFREWESEAESLNDGTWLISGTKSCILDAEYDYYAVFCKTLDYETDIEFPADYERPFGMVGFLLPKEVIEKIETTEEHGIKYQTITFPDLTLSTEEAELLKPDLKATKALNCKGVGQLAVAAMICGQIKSSAQTYFDFLATDSRDLLNQQILESHFADITGKIYALESISYMTAAMHDSYVEGSSDLHLESAIAKTVATESAYDIYNRLQALYGSKYLVTSPMADIVKLYDGFLEGSIFNRMLVGLHGAQFYGAYRNDDIHKRSLLPFFPSYFFTDWFKWRKQEKDEPKLDMGLKKYFRSDFGQHAEMLEYCIKRMEFAADKVVFRWAKDSPNHQIDMWRLGLIAEEVFKLTCMLSRASRTVSESHMDCDAEMYVAKNAVRQSWVKVKDLVWECEYSPYLTGDKRNETIHSKNSKYGGYFAYSPLDRVVY